MVCGRSARGTKLLRRGAVRREKSRSIASNLRLFGYPFLIYGPKLPKLLAKRYERPDFGGNEGVFSSPVPRAPKNNLGEFCCCSSPAGRHKKDVQSRTFCFRTSGSHIFQNSCVWFQKNKHSIISRTSSCNLILQPRSHTIVSIKSSSAHHLFAKRSTMISSRLPQVLRQSRSLQTSLRRTFSSECAPAQKLREVFEDYRQTQ